MKEDMADAAQQRPVQGCIAYACGCAAGGSKEPRGKDGDRQGHSAVKAEGRAQVIGCRRGGRLAGRRCHEPERWPCWTPSVGEQKETRNMRTEGVIDAAEDPEGPVQKTGVERRLLQVEGRGLASGRDQTEAYLRRTGNRPASHSRELRSPSLSVSFKSLSHGSLLTLLPRCFEMGIGIGPSPHGARMKRPLLRNTQPQAGKSHLHPLHSEPALTLMDGLNAVPDISAAPRLLVCPNLSPGPLQCYYSACEYRPLTEQD